MYAFHIFFLCKKKVSLPSWLGGEAWAIPYEVIFGTAATALYLTLAGGKLSGSLARDEVLPTEVDAEEEKGKMAETFIFLGLAYYGSGYAGQGINTLLCLCAALGAPLTIGMCTSLQVLLSHLLWVAAGSWILHLRTGGSFFSRMSKDNPWFRMSMSGNLLWTVIGGYFLTSFISSLALYANPILYKLPLLSKLGDMLKNLPESQTEVIVDQLKNPKGGLYASIAGCIGPCFTGPVWEEVLYRGFLLQALNLFMSLPMAVDLCSLVFALNHMVIVECID